jgi:hypothetical protein
MVRAIRSAIESGVRPESIVIRYHGLKWKWSPAIGAWDRYEEEDHD